MTNDLDQQTSLQTISEIKHNDNYNSNMNSTKNSPRLNDQELSSYSDDNFGYNSEYFQTKENNKTKENNETKERKESTIHTLTLSNSDIFTKDIELIFQVPTNDHKLSEENLLILLKNIVKKCNESNIEISENIKAILRKITLELIGL